MSHRKPIAITVKSPEDLLFAFIKLKFRVALTNRQASHFRS
jgi:hypothetical protein